MRRRSQHQLRLRGRRAWGREGFCDPGPNEIPGTIRAAVGVLLSLCSMVVLPAQTCVDTIAATTPDSRFTINGDEVTDHATNLIWRRCPMGFNGADCEAIVSLPLFTWQQALQEAEMERAVTGQAWRLPNAKELESIVEERCFSPAINLTVFPNAPTAPVFLSASPSGYAGDPSTYAYDVNFDVGRIGIHLKTAFGYVRLVRGQ